MTLIAFSPSARLTLPDGSTCDAIASVQVSPEGYLEVIAEVGDDDPLTLLSMPAGSLAAALAKDAAA